MDQYYKLIDWKAPGIWELLKVHSIPKIPWAFGSQGMMKFAQNYDHTVRSVLIK